MKGKTWDNNKNLMESHNKQFRRVYWTPERKTRGEKGSATLETHEIGSWVNIWLTTVHQHVRCKKSTKKCLRKNLRLKLLGCFNPILA